jgi:hypothetical protein
MESPDRGPLAYWLFISAKDSKLAELDRFSHFHLSLLGLLMAAWTRQM